MARKKDETTKTAPTPRELPALYCAKGRHWVPSQEKHNVFASVDGKAQAVSVWTCPADRGETTIAAQVAGVDAAVAATKSQGDISREEKQGPLRRVMERLSENANSARVKLECGHERTCPKGQKNARCSKCRPGATK